MTTGFCSVLLMALNISLSSFNMGCYLVYFSAIPIDTLLEIYNITIGKALA